MIHKKISQLQQIIQTIIPQTQLQINPDTNTYINTVNGVEYTRVTQTLSVINNPIYQSWRMNRALDYLYEHQNEPIKEELYKKAKEFPEELFKQAGERGNKIHALIDKFLREIIGNTISIKSPLALVDGTIGPPEKDFAVWSALRSFDTWQKETKFEPIASELRVWSDKYHIAGTIDAMGLINDELTLCDWKTSNQFRDDYFLQVAAYWGMFVGLTRYRPKKCIIVKLDKEQGIPKTEVVLNPRQIFKNYLVIKKMYDAIKETHEARKNQSTKNVVIL